MHPYKPALHQFAKEILKDKYIKHAETIEKIGHHFVTQNEVQHVSQCFSDAFEQGYLFCLSQYEAELKRLGISVKII